MNSTEKVESWVVYLMMLHGKQVPMNVVCEQSEWEAMELARPGAHVLVQSGIASEEEAEKLARGTAGDALGRRNAKKQPEKPLMDSPAHKEPSHGQD